MKKVYITLSFEVNSEDMNNDIIKSYIESAQSGRMKQEVEDSVNLSEAPMHNISIDCEVF